MPLPFSIVSGELVTQVASPIVSVIAPSCYDQRVVIVMQGLGKLGAVSTGASFIEKHFPSTRSVFARLGRIGEAVRSREAGVVYASAGGAGTLMALGAPMTLVAVGTLAIAAGAVSEARESKKKDELEASIDKELVMLHKIYDYAIQLKNAKITSLDTKISVTDIENLSRVVSPSIAEYVKHSIEFSAKVATGGIGGGFGAIMKIASVAKKYKSIASLKHKMHAAKELRSKILDISPYIDHTSLASTEGRAVLLGSMVRKLQQRRRKKSRKKRSR